MTQETTPNDTDTTPDRPELSPKVANKAPLIIGLVVLVLLIAAFCGAGYFLFTNPVQTAIIRDISIILLAVQTLVITFVILLLLIVIYYVFLKLQDLGHLLTHEILPILKKLDETLLVTKDTVRAVQSRTVMVGDEAVKPVVRIVSTISALKAIFRTLFGRS